MGLHPTGPSVSSTVTEQTPTSGKVPLQEAFTLMMETGSNSRSLHWGSQGSCVQRLQLRRLQLEPIRDTSDATNLKSNRPETSVVRKRKRERGPDLSPLPSQRQSARHKVGSRSPAPQWEGAVYFYNRV